MIGLDFETSGYCTWATMAPVEIGAVEITEEGTRILASSLISGATWITRAAYATHQIRLRDCYGKPPMSHFRPLIDKISQGPICVHAKGTENKVLREAFGIENIQWVDTLTLSRRKLKSCPNHRLATVTQYLDLEEKLKAAVPHGRWHRAAYDAAASVLIALELGI